MTTMRRGSGPTTSTGRAAASTTVQPGSASSHDDAERLSSDLALFLSNPTLRQGLSDGSLDLASYSSTIEAELFSLEKDCIEIYRSNSQTIASCRVEMDECDSVLGSLQEMLLGFQADLGGLSGDIKALQEQSRTLGVQLRNRRDAELGLRRFLERIVVPPALADRICKRDVDMTFMKCVQELEEKYQYVHITQETFQKDMEQYKTLLSETSCSIPPALTPAGIEMQTHIYKLRVFAVSRVRTYFLQKIAELRRPKTNVRMMQINALLKYSPLVDFLLSASPEIFREIRDVYVESMSKTLHALFRTYAAQLSLLDNMIAGRGDVIAVEDSSLRDMFSSKVNMNKRGDAFYLGDRGSVLEYHSIEPGNSRTNASSMNTYKKSDDNSSRSKTRTGGITYASRSMAMKKNQATPNSAMSSSASTVSAATASMSQNTPIQAHVALAEKRQYPYEVIFKSIMMHLMDATTNEFIFVRQFFKENGPDTLPSILNRSLSLILEQMENYLFNCYDCLGLLLMIKLTHTNKRIMKQRKVDSLDKFFDSVTNLLWPRLKTIMDKQIRSVRDGDARKLGVIDLHAHYVSRRYAEFTCSILQILNKGNKGVNSAVVASAMQNQGQGVTSSSATSNHSMGGGSVEEASHGGKDSRSSSISDVSKTQGKTIVSQRGSAGDMLMNDLSVLLDETVLLLERLADTHTTNKKKIVFLINNLDQIISIFQERRVSGRELNRFVDLLMQQRELFVEEELLQGFSKMIAFVQQTEQHILRPQYSGSSSKLAAENAKMDVNVQVVESLVREFSSTWKQGIEQINRDVLSFFANFRNGMEVLKQVLTQLLLYYTRFQDIIRKVWRSKPPAFCKDLVSTSTILIEIKKYALAI